MTGDSRPPAVDIVIVNWNTGAFLSQCLRSIEHSSTSANLLGQVVVVDNASSDGSAEILIDHTIPVTIIRNTLNVGFARACNQGARHSTADYLLFLNPDTVIGPGTVERVHTFMEEPAHRHIGIAGIRMVNEHGETVVSCARFPTLRVFIGYVTGLSSMAPSVFPPHLLSTRELERSGFVDQVIGSFFFVRRHVFDKLAGFDERFFVYFEEVDFALRARNAGYLSYYLADLSAQHAEGGSSSQVKPERLFYSMRSRLQYGYKNLPRLHSHLLLLLTITVEPLARIARSIAGRSDISVTDILRAYRLLLKHVCEHRRA